MYVYMYAHYMYIHTYIHTFIHIHIYTYMYISLIAYVFQCHHLTIRRNKQMRRLSTCRYRQPRFYPAWLRCSCKYLRCKFKPRQAAEREALSICFLISCVLNLHYFIQKILYMFVIVVCTYQLLWICHADDLTWSLKLQEQGHVAARAQAAEMQAQVAQMQVHAAQMQVCFLCILKQ